MAMQNDGGRPVVGTGLADRLLPVWIGLFTAFIGWLGWQLASAPSISSWNGDPLDPGAFATALTTWGVTFGVVTWVRTNMDSKENNGTSNESRS